MHQAVIFEKMLAFLREGVDFVDTLSPSEPFPTGLLHLFLPFKTTGTPMSRHSAATPTHSQRPPVKAIPGK